MIKIGHSRTEQTTLHILEMIQYRTDNVESISQNLFIFVFQLLKGQVINPNREKSDARFYRQVATLVPSMFCNNKGYKIANNSGTTEAREKNKHKFRIHNIYDIFYIHI